jgi:hypothetical protein
VLHVWSYLLRPCRLKLSFGRLRGIVWIIIVAKRLHDRGLIVPRVGPRDCKPTSYNVPTATL